METLPDIVDVNRSHPFISVFRVEIQHYRLTDEPTAVVTYYCCVRQSWLLTACRLSALVKYKSQDEFYKKSFHRER